MPVRKKVTLMPVLFKAAIIFGKATASAPASRVIATCFRPVRPRTISLRAGLAGAAVAGTLVGALVGAVVLGAGVPVGAAFTVGLGVAVSNDPVVGGTAVGLGSAVGGTGVGASVVGGTAVLVGKGVLVAMAAIAGVEVAAWLAVGTTVAVVVVCPVGLNGTSSPELALAAELVPGVAESEHADRSKQRIIVKEARKCSFFKMNTPYIRVTKVRNY